jgi:hypothetical protein
MKKYSTRKLVFLLATLFLLLACELPFLPAPAASTTAPAPGSLETIVAATAGAAQTQTMMALPSPTHTMTATMPSTLTPTETSTPTPTVIFIIPTNTFTPTETSLPTATQSAGSSCELVDQTPNNGTVYGSRERFNVEWTVKNTGSETWVANNIDFFHSDGRDMHENDILDLPNNVRAGAQVTLRVQMRAPGNAGTYTSTWTLGTQRDALCRVSVRIVVK